MRVRRRRLLAAVVLVVGAGAATALALREPPAPRPSGPFEAAPYLQWGPVAAPGPGAGPDLLWHADDRDADWSVELQEGTEGPWRAAGAPTYRRVAVGGVAPHRVYRATLAGLAPGEGFAYRVKRGGLAVFEARAKAPPPAGAPARFVLFGDGGSGTAASRAIACAAYRLDPDLVVLTGDLVYQEGRIDEYRRRFFPVYNADRDDPEVGAPLLRSHLTIAAPGNHDLLIRDLDRHPDALAYFYYWDQPLDGPPAAFGDRGTPTPRGSPGRVADFLRGAGPAFPRMAGFSLDCGDVHWTVLDGNPYVDWSDPDRRAWLERDLAAAQGATWRFVVVHQPPFHSSRSHAEEQRVRLLAQVFERGGVDIVFSGHVHNYQRTAPLRFERHPGPPDRFGRVAGSWRLDPAFDGRTRTVPDGVLYVVTGAGGARRYDEDRDDDPTSWRDFTRKFVSNVHSLTVADVDGPRLTIRQLDAGGRERDRFVVTKPSQVARAGP